MCTSTVHVAWLCVTVRSCWHILYMLYPACHVETDCKECLNGGTFMGDACECSEGFSGTYCEVEGVLLYEQPSTYIESVSSLLGYCIILYDEHIHLSHGTLHPL